MPSDRTLTHPAVQHGCGLHSYGLYSYGLYSYGIYSYGLYGYGLHSYGRAFGSNPPASSRATDIPRPVLIVSRLTL